MDIMDSSGEWVGRKQLTCKQIVVGSSRGITELKSGRRGNRRSPRSAGCLAFLG